MKILIFTFLLMVSIYGKGQSVIADPAVSQIDVINVANTNLNARQIPLDNIIKLKIPIYNFNLINGLPARSCKVKIGLGSKLVMDPLFNLSSLASSAYFDWTAEFVSGQVQITGDLKTDLPSNFANIVEFNVKGSLQGNSTITTNFLVTNHNTAIILSDAVPSNNTSFLGYTVVPAGPLPVTFTGLTAINKGCSILIDFYTENEINVSRYEIELSKDGTNYVKIASLLANSQPHYHADLAITDAIKSPLSFVRIKSIDKDGNFKYSGIKSVKGTCENEWALGVFPNPAARTLTSVTISTRQGSFNGRYTIVLSDMTGKKILSKEMNLTNLDQFNFETGNLSAGQYLINIHNQKMAQSAVIKWQKY